MARSPKRMLHRAPSRPNRHHAFLPACCDGSARQRPSPRITGPATPWSIPQTVSHQSPVTSLAPRVPPVHSSPDTGVTLVSHSRDTRVTPASPLLAASTGGRPLMAERVNGGRPLPPVRCLRPVSIRSNVLPVRNCSKYEHASSHLSSVSIVAFSAKTFH